ncbi:hypothetical protein COCOBI_06-4560 [Coccomyxa sp. Obi]|nr:hypothetical protein COCOBI_06-4560 [Coccomyxa sp. Obi]
MSLPGSVAHPETAARHGRATGGQSPVASPTPGSAAAAQGANAPELEQHRSRRKAAAPKRASRGDEASVMEQQARVRQEEGAALVDIKGRMLKRKTAAKVLGTVLEGKRKRSAPGRMGVYVPLTSTIICTDLRPERTPEPAVDRAAVEPALELAMPGAHLPRASRKQTARAAAKPKTGTDERGPVAASPGLAPEPHLGNGKLISQTPEPSDPGQVPMSADEDEPHVPDMGQPLSGPSDGPLLPGRESCRSSGSHKQQSKGVEVDKLPSMSGAAGAEAASLAPGSACKEELQPVLIPNDILEELQSVGKAATGPVSLDPEHFRLLLTTIVHYQHLIRRYMKSELRLKRAARGCVRCLHMRDVTAPSTQQPENSAGAREDGAKNSAGPSPAAGQGQREPAAQPKSDAAGLSVQASIGSLAQEARRAERAPSPAPAIHSVGQRGPGGAASQSRQIGASLGPGRGGSAKVALLPASAARLPSRRGGISGRRAAAPTAVRGRSRATPPAKPQNTGAGCAAAAQSGPSAAGGRPGQEGRAVCADQDLGQDHDRGHGGGAVLWAIWGGGEPSQAATPAEGPPLCCGGSAAVQTGANGLAEVPQRDRAADNGGAGAGHRPGVLLESSDSRVYISDAEGEAWECKHADSWHEQYSAGW